MENLIHTNKFNLTNDDLTINDLGNNVYQLVDKVSTEVVEVLNVDVALKQMTIRHRHTTYDLVFKNELDLVLDKMGIKRAVDNVSPDVKAPMPGKVIDVVVKEGDQIAKGDAILILEAMKMENVLKAEADCSIKKVLVSSAENVEKNQVLVELNPA
jgi:biotin carboxyl carrier protein